MTANENNEPTLTQEQALELARQATGTQWNTVDQVGQGLKNAITDKRDGSTDWSKILLLGGAATIGGFLSSGLGIGGFLGVLTIGAGALLGAGVMSFFTDMIVNFFREVKAPSSPPVFESRTDFQINERVVTEEKLRLPEVQSLSSAEDLGFPEYHPEEQPQLAGNPRLVEVQKTITRLREVAGDGKPYHDADVSPEQASINAELRDLVAKLERDANEKKLNLRYTRDEMARILPGSNERLQSYLSRIGVGSEQAGGITPQMELSDIPGVHSNFPPQLDHYGQTIMKYLIAAGRRREGSIAQDDSQVALGTAYSNVDINALSREDIKAAEVAWSTLSVEHKRVMIHNFAQRALREGRNANGELEYDDFFPESHFDFLLFKKKVRIYNPSDYVNVLAFWSDDEREKLIATHRQAQKDHNWAPLATLLEERLHDAQVARDNGAPLLDDEHMRKLQVYILGLRAREHLDTLSVYEQGPYQQEVRQLDHFERDMLPQYSAQVTRLRGAMQGLEQTRILVLEESPLRDHMQTINIRDFRSETPQNLTVELKYSQDDKKLESVTVTNAAGQSVTTEVSGEAPKTTAQIADMLNQVIPADGSAFKTASIETSRDQQYAAMLETGPKNLDEKEKDMPTPGLPVAVARPPAREDISVSHA